MLTGYIIIFQEEFVKYFFLIFSYLFFYLIVKASNAKNFVYFSQSTILRAVRTVLPQERKVSVANKKKL